MHSYSLKDVKRMNDGIKNTKLYRFQSLSNLTKKYHFLRKCFIMFIVVLLFLVKVAMKAKNKKKVIRPDVTCIACGHIFKGSYNYNRHLPKCRGKKRQMNFN